MGNQSKYDYDVTDNNSIFDHGDQADQADQTISTKKMKINLDQARSAKQDQAKSTNIYTQIN